MCEAIATKNLICNYQYFIIARHILFLQENCYKLLYRAIKVSLSTGNCTITLAEETVFAD